MVRRRGDDRHELRAALGGFPDVLYHHAIGLGIEPAPVLGDLFVVGELIVVAQAEPERLPGRGDGCRLRLEQ
jgi:hypothetical protein